jgi:hypothetical protein
LAETVSLNRLQGGSCGPCAISTLRMKEKDRSTFGGMMEEYLHLKGDFGSTKFDRSLSKLSCHSTEQVSISPISIFFKFFGHFFSLVDGENFIRKVKKRHQTTKIK